MNKIERLFDMTEHPDRYSDSEWRALLGDKPVSEAEKEEAWRNVLAAATTKATPDTLTATTPNPSSPEEGNTKEEFQPTSPLQEEFHSTGPLHEEFQPTSPLHEKFQPTSPLLRGGGVRGGGEKPITPFRSGSKKRRFLKAAAILAILMLSGIAVAAIHSWRMERGATVENSLAPQQQEDQLKAAVLAPNTTLPDSLHSHKTFENAALGDMLSELADYYHARLDIRNDDVSTLRLYYEWNPADSLAAIVETLNAYEHFDIALEDSTIVVN